MKSGAFRPCRNYPSCAQETSNIAHHLDKSVLMMHILVIVKRQHVKFFWNIDRQRIGCQADEINFQQTSIHSPTKLVTITFTQHDKWHNPPVQETRQSMCTKRTKDKTGTTPGNVGNRNYVKSFVYCIILISVQSYIMYI